MKKVILLSIIVLKVLSANAQTWTTVGSGLQGTGDIESMCVYNGELYVGGQFDSIGGIKVNSIARWNGNTWDSVPGAYQWVNGYGYLAIFAMTVYNNELIIGGNIYLNDTVIEAVVKWNGSSWSTLGSGIDGVITAMEVYNNELYVSGNLDSAGGLPTNGIARWNGSLWDSVGGSGLGIRNNGTAFSVYNNNLYLTGSFGEINGVPIRCLAKWNGVSWDSVGIYHADIVPYSLAVYNNNLYIGGEMIINNNLTVRNICSWNDTLLDSVGLGLNNFPSVLISYNNELYAAGQFDTAGVNQALGIARWNNSQWNAVGSGLDLFLINQDTIISGTDTILLPNENILSMCVYNNELYVGGTFTKIGGIAASSIAKWSNLLSVSEINSYNSFTIYPNPLTSSSILQLNTQVNNAEVIIYDMVGKELMRKKLTGDKMEIERGSLESGVYFVKVISAEMQWVEKMMVE